ncbi:MAG TPA: GNAT family protein [Propionibacteriaceae bacterium]|nr:GNAT family protein [Propionibacteriaceae bacterium]
MAVGIRVVTEDDASTLAELLTGNRTFLAPWDPVRDDAYFTVDGQRDLLARSLRRLRSGIDWPGVITVDGAPVGRVNLNNVIRGAFCSADLGYWVDQAHNGRGVATAAVGAVVQLAFTELGLHRVQAGTLLHNRGSQKVLERNGFTPIGVAPRYLNIAGRWQDHLLFQRLADDPRDVP